MSDSVMSHTSEIGEPIESSSNTFNCSQNDEPDSSVQAQVDSPTVATEDIRVDNEELRATDEIPKICNMKLGFNVDASESSQKRAHQTPRPESRLFQNTRSSSARAIGGSLNTNEKTKSTAASIDKRSKSAGVKRRPTVPIGPQLRVDSRAGRQVQLKLSTEDIECIKLEEDKKRVEEIMKRRQKMFQVLKSKGSIPTTVRSTKELTIPTTPYSHMESRFGKREDSFPAQKEQPKDEIRTVKRSGPTRPQPFNFSTETRLAARSEMLSPAASTCTAAEILQKFHQDPRSHEVPKARRSVTQPTSPRLQTKTRSKSCGRVRPPSREELEEAAMREAQSHAFHAKPVNKKIFESMGEYGVPRVQAKESTQPTEFRLASNLRASMRSSQKPVEEEQQQEFKARPMPNFKDDPRTKIKRKESRTTEAHSPKLSGGTRASSAPARRQRPSHVQVEKEKEALAKKWIEDGKRLLCLTEPEEFQLKTSVRGLAAKAKFDSKMVREMDEQRVGAEVRARPFPEKIFKKSFTPAHSSKPLTEIEEFHLATDERHLKLASKLNDQKENTLDNQFHAIPLPKSTYEPDFTVSLTPRNPLIPKNINLQTDARAVQRKSFDDSVELIKAEQCKAKEKEEIERKREEERIIKNLRRLPVDQGGLSFKASPVLTEDPFPSKLASTPALTEPVSPQLRTAMRNRINQV